MRAGRLRRLFTYQTPISAEDALGGSTNTFADAFTFWGDIRQPTGREALNAAQMKSSVSHVISARWLASSTAAVNPKGRLILDGQVFNITSAVNVERRNRELLVNVIEVVTPP